jgi:hypothetical protein
MLQFVFCSSGPKNFLELLHICYIAYFNSLFFSSNQFVSHFFLLALLDYYDHHFSFIFLTPPLIIVFVIELYHHLFKGYGRAFCTGGDVATCVRYIHNGNYNISACLCVIK